jgi:hypothetical protein
MDQVPPGGGSISVSVLPEQEYPTHGAWVPARDRRTVCLAFL